MKKLLITVIALALPLGLRAEAVKSLADFQAAADKANEILVIPEWPKTPTEVEDEVNNAIAKANAGLDVIGKQDLSKVTFDSTVVALDNLQNDAQIAIQKTVVVQQTSQQAAMRDAAEKAVKVFQDWAVGIDYREDVDKAGKAFADTKAELEGVPDIVLESPGVKTGDDTYTILANVTFQYNTVEETAKSEATRKHLYEVRFNLARDKNVS